MSQPPAHGPYVPGPYVPGPYGQAPAPQQGGVQAWSPPAPSAQGTQPSPSPWLAIVAVGLGLTLIFAASFLAGRLTAPTATTVASTNSAPSAVATTTSAPASGTGTPVPNTGTPTKGFTYNGSTLTGPNFTATLPSGWMVSETNGKNNDGEAVGPPGRIYYYAGGTLPAATICSNIVTTLRAAPSDPVTDVTGVRWGALNAVAKDIVTKNKDDAGTVTNEPIVYDVYCVDLPTGASSLLLSASTPAEHAATKAAAEQFLAAWTWR